MNLKKFKDKKVKGRVFTFDRLKCEEGRPDPRVFVEAGKQSTQTLAQPKVLIL